MKIGYHTGYFSRGPEPGIQDLIAHAEELGFDSVWTGETYGSDAISPLAWWGSSCTSTMRLGTSVLQIGARTPTATAMAAMTMDHLSGGRFILGLGPSSAPIVEGWYGQPYAKPLARMREYVAVIREVFAREAPVTFDGEFFKLPYPGGTGLGKPLKSIVHPLRKDLPIYLAAEGPRNVALTAEIADGWLPLFFSPKADDYYRECLAEGFARPGARRTLDNFDVAAFVPVAVHDDVETAANMVRPTIGLYVGGMGAKTQNFHVDVLTRLGYGEVCEEVQSLFLSGRKSEAMAAIPMELIEDVALVGPPAKIRDDLHKWEKTVATTILVQTPAASLPALAEIFN